MICKHCKREMQKDFSFCPYCGQEIVRGLFSDLFEDIDKMFRGENVKTINLPHGQITVKISAPQRLQPLRKIEVANAPVQDTMQKTRFPDKVVEPKSTVARREGKLYYDVKMPTVRSIEDIHLNVLGASVEIKAIGKNVTYFKVLPLPEGSEIANKEFRDGRLLITLT